MILLAMIAATAFPQIATVSPLYLLMRALGLRDTWLALILANGSFALPLVIWLLTGFIREISAWVLRAAAGCAAQACAAGQPLRISVNLSTRGNFCVFNVLWKWGEKGSRDSALKVLELFPPPAQ